MFNKNKILKDEIESLKKDIIFLKEKLCCDTASDREYRELKYRVDRNTEEISFMKRQIELIKTPVKFIAPYGNKVYYEKRARMRAEQSSFIPAEVLGVNPNPLHFIREYYVRLDDHTIISTGGELLTPRE